MTVTAAICGLSARKVTVEADASEGMPLFQMVGYLSSEVREAQDRVRTALKNAGYHLPVKRITVNLAPADLRKEGSGYDLPIAVSVLAAIGVVSSSDLEGVLLAGELSLNGRLHGIRGILEIVSNARAFGCHTCILPNENLAEGSVIRDVRVLGADTLQEVVSWLNGEGKLQSMTVDLEQARARQERKNLPDFKDIRGQMTLKKAAETAVAGFHNLLIIGPPGAGKTMTAHCIPSILPPVTIEEALEISRIHSVAGTLPPQEGLMLVRPFRSPHHTATRPALAGGGTVPRPGEISLAHRGILYLDELPEFQKETLEILRQPLEDHRIVLSRTMGNYTFPAHFMLVASMNPCKCGYFPDRSRCSCSIPEVKRYLNHISQPLLDRIDICAEAEEVTYDELSGERVEESSAQIRRRVEAARCRQQERYRGTPFRSNADLDRQGISRFCRLGTEEEKLMRLTYEKFHMTGRSYMRVLRVARTVADLEGSDEIRRPHLAEAIAYRLQNGKYWKM